MIPYLNNLLANLPAIQTKQLLRILSQQRDKGEIRTAGDFNKKLAELAELVGEDKFSQRTPPIIFNEGELTESDILRVFFQMAQMDLEAILGEMERIGDTIRAHHKMLADNYFDALESAVFELETDVRAYEVLSARKFTGFSDRIKSYNFTGSSSIPGARKDDLFSLPLFKDSRGGESLFFSPPALAEVGLSLAPKTDENFVIHKFNKVGLITDSTTPQTAFSTATPENIPSNMLDLNPNTEWKHSILLGKHPPSCRLKVALSFVGARRINGIMINPISDSPIRVMDISYIDSGEQEQSLSIGALYSSPNYAGSSAFSYGIAGEVRFSPLGGDGTSSEGEDYSLANQKILIPLGDITARKIIITFQQDSAGDGEFFYFDQEEGYWSKDLYGAISFQHLSEEAQETGIIEDSKTDPLLTRFHEYIFGLKDIYAIEREYHPTGFFVPEPIEIDSPLTLALFTNAEYPNDDPCDIEFLLQKENYDSNKLLVDTETFPFLPFGTTSVNERLFLTEKSQTSALSDIGLLRFYPDFTEDFFLYQESTLLTIGVDYYISVDGSTYESVLPPISIPSTFKQCRIRLLSPKKNAIFRTVYNPLISTEEAGGEVWLNPERSVRLDRYQTYLFDKNRATGEILRSKLGLQILVRANTFNTRVSPYLKEMIILGD